MPFRGAPCAHCAPCALRPLCNPGLPGGCRGAANGRMAGHRVVAALKDMKGEETSQGQSTRPGPGPPAPPEPKRHVAVPKTKRN